MKLAFLFSCLFIGSSASAVILEIHAPCHNRIALRDQSTSVSPTTSLGKFTVEFLTKSKMPFIGSEVGINSIFNTPQGDESLIVISNSEMLAYGWCFHHNGIESDVLANQVPLKNTDHIKWFFAYAHYKNGQWLSMCNPAHLRPLKTFCQ